MTLLGQCFVALFEGMLKLASKSGFWRIVFALGLGAIFGAISAQIVPHHLITL